MLFSNSHLTFKLETIQIKTKAIIIVYRINRMKEYSIQYSDKFHLSLVKHFDVLIHCRPAQSTNPRQFRHSHGAFRIGGIILNEHSGKVSFCSWPSSYLLALGFRVRHTRPHPRPNHG